MVIHLCKIAVFHPVNSDTGLSQSFHFKMFSEGTRGQATGCPVGTPCLWEVPLRAASAISAESPVAKPSHTGPGLSMAEVYLKGFLLSMKLNACLTFLQNEGCLGSKSNQWHVQAGSGLHPGSALPICCCRIAPATHTHNKTDM